MDRQAWLDWRRQGLGGTDISAIRGEHPWRSPWDVYLSKVHATESADRPEFAIGRWLERPIAEWAAGELSAALHDAPSVASADEPWMRVSPDFYVDSGAGWTLLEIKTDLFPGEKWGLPPEGHVPSHYFDQVQWQLAITEPGVRTDIALLAVYLKGSNDRRIYTIEADPHRQAELRDFGRAWWDRHVVARVPPAPDGTSACEAGLKLLHPSTNGRLRVGTEAEEAAARDLAHADEMLQSWTARRDDLRNTLRAAIGDDEGLRFSSGRVKRTATNRLTVRFRE